MNLSFAGCGFLGIYHVGVACCFRQYAPHLLLNKISGASAGAFAACCLICDMPLGDITSDVLRVAIEARSRSLGPFAPSFDINKLLMEGLLKFLPDDAHIRVSGKLHVSLTRVHDGKNVMVSQFDSKKELIDALLASAFIPIFSGLIPPKFKGVRYMDGGYSDNLPTLDENTITVSPFCGESDICPRDDSSQLFHINVANTSIELSKHNIYRMVRILFPPKPEVLSNMCKQGFDDALRFLHRNNLINCARCLAVQSTYVVSETIDENLEYDPQCKECKIHRQEALVSNMPDTVLNIFQDAIDSANKGIFNWLFKNPGMKLLSVLTLPYTVPADLMLATFTKLMVAAPQVGNSVWEVSKYFKDQLSSILNKVNRKRQQLGAKVTCQLAITEYGRDAEESSDGMLENKMNLDFTVDLDDSDLSLVQSSAHQFNTNKLLKRNTSFTINKTDTIDDDTFDHILQVTSQHDTIITFYYLDEDNKVKVTEIFDVTDSDSPIVQTSHEKDINRNLQFDDDWDESTWTTQTPYDGENYTIEDILEADSSNIFSDPESEWTGTCKIEEPPEDDDDLNSFNSDIRPESERNYKIPSFSYEEIDD